MPMTDEELTQLAAELSQPDEDDREECPTCGGTGLSEEDGFPCEDCGGAGYIEI